jgi:hypothetical protein
MIVVFAIMVVALLAAVTFKFVLSGSGSVKLSSDQVKDMIRQNNTFDRIWNKYGHFNNSFDKKSVKGRLVVVDESTGLMWYFSGSRNPMKHERIQGWMEWFNQQSFGGFDDWRLPTLKEAATLLTASNPKDALYVDQRFSRTQKFIWTSNLYGRNGAWVVRFDEGYILGCPFDLENFIRPVRSLK